MEDHELRDRLKGVEQKIEMIYTSTEKTRKYFMWTLIISLVVFVLPLIGLVFVIPSFLASFGELTSF